MQTKEPVKAAQTKEPEPQKEVVRSVQPIQEGRFQDASFMRNVWSVDLPREVPFDDVLRPEFWSHVAYRLREKAKIEVYRTDGTEYAELLVTRVDRVSAKVVLLNRVALVRESSIPVDPAYAIDYAGTHEKFRIVRRSDGHVVEEGHKDEESARNSLREYLKALAA